MIKLTYLTDNIFKLVKCRQKSAKFIKYRKYALSVLRLPKQVLIFTRDPGCPAWRSACSPWRAPSPPRSWWSAKRRAGRRRRSWTPRTFRWLRSPLCSKDTNEKMKWKMKFSHKFRKFLAFSKFLSHFSAKSQYILSFPDNFCEIPGDFH